MEQLIKVIATKIEALLFALGKPLSRAELVKMLEVSPEDLERAIASLMVGGSENRGVVLVDDGRMIELRTAPSVAELVTAVRKAEFSRELGRAGAEVIAILLYNGPSTRAQIDFIRGVNSAQSVRTLSMRGLVRRVTSEGSAVAAGSGRSNVYELTSDLLGSLGINRRTEAPEFENIAERLEALHGQQAP